VALHLAARGFDSRELGAGDATEALEGPKRFEAA
jgi:hypothetical protein